MYLGCTSWQPLYTSLFELIYLHERKNIKEQSYLLGNDCLHREFESLSNRRILKGFKCVSKKGVLKTGDFDFTFTAVPTHFHTFDTVRNSRRFISISREYQVCHFLYNSLILVNGHEYIFTVLILYCS